MSDGTVAWFICWLRRSKAKGRIVLCNVENPSGSGERG